MQIDERHICVLQHLLALQLRCCWLRDVNLHRTLLLLLLQ
jgi:hypothetical protein